MLRNLRLLLSITAEANTNCINARRSRLLLKYTKISTTSTVRTKKDDYSNNSFTSLIKPVPIKHSQDDINIGAELTGTAIDKAELLKILTRFSQKREIRLLCMDHGLDRKLLTIAFFSQLNVI